MAGCPQNSYTTSDDTFGLYLLYRGLQGARVTDESRDLRSFEIRFDSNRPFRFD